MRPNASDAFVEAVEGLFEGANVNFCFDDRIDAEKTKRLLLGERKHGPLNLETDRRDFIQEGVEELIDFLNYVEFAMLQGKVSFCKWASIDKDIRFIVFRLLGGRW